MKDELLCDLMYEVDGYKCSLLDIVETNIDGLMLSELLQQLKLDVNESTFIGMACMEVRRIR